VQRYRRWCAKRRNKLHFADHCDNKLSQKSEKCKKDIRKKSYPQLSSDFLRHPGLPKYSMGLIFRYFTGQRNPDSTLPDNGWITGTGRSYRNPRMRPDNRTLVIFHSREGYCYQFFQFGSWVQVVWKNSRQGSPVVWYRGTADNILSHSIHLLLCQNWSL